MVMSQIYTADVGEITGRNRRTPEDRLSQRTAVVAIAALSLLFWLPILLPFAALLHR
jgi:hypothetical protein